MCHGSDPTRLVLEGDPTVLVIPTDFVVEGVPQGFLERHTIVNLEFTATQRSE